MSTEISNSKSLMRAFRRVYSRAELAEIIGTSPLSIQRWERGEYFASGRFASGFERAIRQLAQEFGHFEEVQDAILRSMKVKTRPVYR